MAHTISIVKETKNVKLGTVLMLKRAIKVSLREQGVKESCEISVVLTDNEGIRAINKENRGIDRETDVLSFPFNNLVAGKFKAEDCERNMDTGKLYLGDMVLSLEKCHEQAETFGHTYFREIMYLSVHSVLHLLGYDHLDEAAEKKQMRDREKAIMKILDGDDD